MSYPKQPSSNRVAPAPTDEQPPYPPAANPSAYPPTTSQQPDYPPPPYATQQPQSIGYPGQPVTYPPQAGSAYPSGYNTAQYSSGYVTGQPPAGYVTGYAGQANYVTQPHYQQQGRAGHTVWVLVKHSPNIHNNDVNEHKMLLAARSLRLNSKVWKYIIWLTAHSVCSSVYVDNNHRGRHHNADDDCLTCLFCALCLCCLMDNWWGMETGFSTFVDNNAMNWKILVTFCQNVICVRLHA